MRILSFDASSTTIGYSILDVNVKKIKLLHVGHYKPPKEGNIFERLFAVEQYITNLVIEHKPDEVVIEDIIKFMPRNSSANTIIILALFNRIVGLSCWKITGKEPHLFTVMDIRHGIKLSSQLPAKEEMPNLVGKHLKKKLKPELKKSGKPKDEFYDEADAIACGLYYAYVVTDQLDLLKKQRKI